MRKKDYSEEPQTLGEHLRKRRKELGLLQREAATLMAVDVFTLINWEKGRTVPIASRFRPILEFLGYDPLRSTTTLSERVQAIRRLRGLTLQAVAVELGWDEGTLTRYLSGTWRMPADRANTLEEFLRADAAPAESPRPQAAKR